MERWDICWHPPAHQAVCHVRFPARDQGGKDDHAVPDELKFDPELAQTVNILPQHVHESAPHDQAFREQVIPQASIPHEGDVDKKLKRLYIRQNDIVTFGHTPGLPEV